MDFYHFTTSTLVSSSDIELIGFSIVASTDAEVVLRNGDDDLATGVVFVLLGSQQSIISEPKINLEGLYVDVVSGTVEGTVWVR